MKWIDIKNSLICTLKCFCKMSIINCNNCSTYFSTHHCFSQYYYRFWSVVWMDLVNCLDKKKLVCWSSFNKNILLSIHCNYLLITHRHKHQCRRHHHHHNYYQLYNPSNILCFATVVLSSLILFLELFHDRSYTRKIF